MKILKASVFIMAIIAGFLVIGSLLSSFGVWQNYYKSIIFAVMAGVFVVIMVWCLIKFKFSLKKIGFYLVHVGLCIIIVFAFVSWIFKVESSFKVAVNPNSYYGEVLQEDGSYLKFGFKISVSNFEVEKYPPEYRLYDSSGQITEKHILIDSVSPNKNGAYDLGKYGKVLETQLKTSSGYVQAYRLPNGNVLIRQAQADKNYRATMNIVDGGTRSITLEVNKPYTYKGWKFYLMGYDENSLDYVFIYAKKDVANIPLYFGIVMLMGGIFVESYESIKQSMRAEK